MTSEPRVNCQRGGKGLVRVGLSDKGVGTSTLSLSLFLSLFRYLLLSLPISFILVIILSLSLSFSRNLLSRVTARARPLFFPSFRIPNFIFIGRRFRARARFVARISRNNGLPRGELNRKRIKSSCHPAPPHRLAL